MSPHSTDVSFRIAEKTVSKLGFGCIGLSSHNNSVSDEAGIAIIKHAFERGITYFDPTDMYGPKTNKILVGKICTRGGFF
ncbi:putative aldo-keto reductase 1 [Gossypium australe]|uniref:Putative aldo-keto reductase 1 n=1 Tax=Gossypium australe TaxID=47621 RepID=A0A5B6VC12_9ROSI|nr:putative aldo-keto reductase 1 [Gossypium australe]